MKAFKNISRLEVYLNISQPKIKVGTLILNENKIYFKYNTHFLENSHNISPFKLKFTDEIQQASTDVFDGLHGVFADALPDGWGRLLLDRFLRTKSQDPSRLSPIDRLAFVGDSAAGALEFLPVIDIPMEADKKFYLLEEYAAEALSFLAGENSLLLDELYNQGGASGGARPKIEIGYNTETEQLVPLNGEIAKDIERWIVKFRSTNDLPDIANVEYAYSQMAINAGIKMSACKLFPSEKKDMYFFGTKRFDRKGDEKMHKHSAAGLLHDNFRSSTLDYGHLMDAAFQLQKSRDAYDQVLRVAAFNVFTLNQDDHSKNFSFLMNDKGEWDFSPAYDLTYSPSIYNFHSTAVAGTQQNVNGEHLKKLSKHFDVKGGDEIIAQVFEVVQHWKKYASEAGVTKMSTKEIQARIKSIKIP